MRGRAIAAAGVLPALCCWAQSYRVTGTVLDAERGKTLANIQVNLFLGGVASSFRTMKTGQDGRFAFENVADGRWSLEAESRRFPLQRYGSTGPVSGSSVAVVTGPQRVSEGLAFKIHRAGMIVGRIVDEGQDPVVSAHVQVHVVTAAGGKMTALHAGYAYTNTNGEYAIGGLLPASYYVSATGTPWHAEHVREERDRLAFPATYFPQETDARMAQTVPVRAGEETKADMVMRAQASVKLTVKSGGKVVGVRLTTQGAMDAVVSMPGTGESGPTSHRVAPGRYKAWVVESAVQGARGTIIEAGPGDTEIEIGGAPVASLEMRFKHDGIPLEALTRAFVLLSSEAGQQVSPRQIPASGNLKLGSINAGAYRLLVRRVGGAEFAVSKMEVEGAGYERGLLRLEEGKAAKAVVHLTAALGRLHGFVFEAGRPKEGMVVVILPKGDDSREVYSYLTDSDGSFDFLSLQPGEYGLYLAAHDPDVEYGKPEVARRLMESARLVRVAAGETAEVRLEVARQ